MCQPQPLEVLTPQLLEMHQETVLTLLETALAKGVTLGVTQNQGPFQDSPLPMTSQHGVYAGPDTSLVSTVELLMGFAATFN